MKKTITIETHDTVSRSAMRLISNPDRAPSFLSLVYLKLHKGSFWYFEKPGNPPITKPVLTNGHWLLTRTEKTAKKFDQLLAKVRKITETPEGDIVWDSEGWPLYNGREPEWWRMFDKANEVDYRSIGDIPLIEYLVTEENKALVIARELNFDLYYFAPFFTFFDLYLPGEKEYPAVAKEDEEIVGFLMPRRME